MTSFPTMSDADQKKPLCYDPKRDRFIYYTDLLSKQAKIIPLQHLSHDQLKRLILERNRVGSDYTVTTLNGEHFSRDQVMLEIAQETPFGKMTLEAEASMVSDLLKRIEIQLSQG